MKRSLGPCTIPRESVVHGDRAPFAPDLYFSASEGKIILREGIRPGPLFAPSTSSSGTHRREGILAMAGPRIARGFDLDEAHIRDIAPTLLALTGTSIPPGLDGELLESTLHQSVAWSMGAAEAPTPTGETVQWSDEDDARVREELRGLGYLDE